MRSSAVLRRVKWDFLTGVSGQHIGAEMYVRNRYSKMCNAVEERRPQAVYSTAPTKYMHIHILYEQNAKIQGNSSVPPGFPTSAVQ